MVFLLVLDIALNQTDLLNTWPVIPWNKILVSVPTCVFLETIDVVICLLQTTHKCFFWYVFLVQEDFFPPTL